MTRSRRGLGAVLRTCLVTYLLLQIVGTPIHLYLEPHSDLAQTRASRTTTQATSVIGGEAHDSDSDHERHSATQHDQKALRAQRAPAADLAGAVVPEFLPAVKDCQEEQVSVFSGLSPPELHQSWQFVFRTALPIRAPSLAS